MKISVKVKPNSGENSIKKLDDGGYEVKVSVPPEKGKANQKVIDLLSKELKIPKTRISIIKGVTSKTKLFSVEK